MLEMAAVTDDGAHERALSDVRVSREDAWQLSKAASG